MWYKRIFSSKAKDIWTDKSREEYIEVKYSVQLREAVANHIFFKKGVFTEDLPVMMINQKQPV